MSKTKEKNAPQGNILGFLLLDTLTTKFWMENLTQRWTWSGHFLYLLPYIFLKIVELTVLTMPGLWICLIILHVRQAFENVSGSKGARGSMCKGYTELWICLYKARYATIMPEYALTALNMPEEHGWILLNVPEYVWINCSDYDRVLNVPHHLRYLAGFWICLNH